MSCRVAVSCDVLFGLLAPQDGSSTSTAADKAVALLDAALQRCQGSSSQPTASTSGTSSWSHAPPQFVAIHIEDMTPTAAQTNRQGAPCNKVCWRVTAEASSKPGPVCPAAPTRPRPRTVLLPANEVHALWNNL